MTRREFLRLEFRQVGIDLVDGNEAICRITNCPNCPVRCYLNYDSPNDCKYKLGKYLDEEMVDELEADNG